MRCEFCIKNDSVEVELQNIHELMHQRLYPNTYDFDVDGKLLKVCPRCFTVDNLNLRATRELLISILENKSGYSRRDKKLAANLMCTIKRFEGDERKIAMKTIVNQTKWTTDKATELAMAEFFDVGVSKIATLFFNAKIYRMIMQNNGHKRKKQRRNWRVIPYQGDSG